MKRRLRFVRAAVFYFSAFLNSLFAKLIIE